MTGKNRGSSLLAPFQAAGSVGGIGCAVPLLVIAAIFFGQKLDAWLGTKPLMLVVMLLSVIGASFLFLLSSARSAADAAYRDYRASREAGAATPRVPRNPYEEDDN